MGTKNSKKESEERLTKARCWLKKAQSRKRNKDREREKNKKIKIIPPPKTSRLYPNVYSSDVHFSEQNEDDEYVTRQRPGDPLGLAPPPYNAPDNPAVRPKCPHHHNQFLSRPAGQTPPSASSSCSSPTPGPSTPPGWYAAARADKTSPSYTRSGQSYSRCSGLNDYQSELDAPEIERCLRTTVMIEHFDPDQRLCNTCSQRYSEQTEGKNHKYFVNNDNPSDVFFRGNSGRGGFRGRGRGRRGGGAGNGGGGQRRNDECHYCKRFGHWSRDCRKRMRDEAGGGRGGRSRPQQDSS